MQVHKFKSLTDHFAVMLAQLKMTKELWKCRKSEEMNTNKANSSFPERTVHQPEYMRTICHAPSPPVQYTPEREACIDESRHIRHTNGVKQQQMRSYLTWNEKIYFKEDNKWFCVQQPNKISLTAANACTFFFLQLIMLLCWRKLSLNVASLSHFCYSLTQC